MEASDEKRNEDLLDRRTVRNPFDVTKATDLTDTQIIDTWVEIHNGALRDLLHIDSTMPRFLIGGKGGGRTHLMRYSSFAVQLRRARVASSGPAHYFQTDGYLGLYFRCGGLNAARFSGKSVSAEAWHAIFAYYTDLWLGRLYVQVLQRFLSETDLDLDGEQRFAEVARNLLGAGNDLPPSLESIGNWISAELQSIDRAVNNAAIVRAIDVTIRTNPGDLVFQLARAGAATFKPLQDLRIVYLLDEFENLTEGQQTYVNTLIREKELPVNFVIGSRRYGVRTQATLSAGEVNRRGSEYDEIVLEDYYRAEKGQYEEFCKTLVSQRLLEHRFEVPDDIRHLFAIPDRGDGFSSVQALPALHETVGSERRHFRRLLRQAEDFSDLTQKQADAIVDSLRFDAQPLIEKFALFQLYRHWARTGQLSEQVAQDIARQATLLRDGRGSKNLRVTFNHYRGDLLAQLLHENKAPIGHYGISNFILMSGYLPRNLLVTLKQITRWAIFQGEEPFRGKPISLEAQRRGISDSSAWFLKNARAIGVVGEENEAIITRIGSFLRALRFFDKPTEVSVCMVAVQRSRISSRARFRLDKLVEHSLLIELADGLQAKNGEDVLAKYQFHPMLAPSFDLPIGRRGSIILSEEEVEVLFDPQSDEQHLRALLRVRAARMSAPFRAVDLGDDGAAGGPDLAIEEMLF